LDINDLSPFLKSGKTDAIFHCVGNSDLDSDKLNKREIGTQTVLHVFLKHLMTDGIQTLRFSKF
jgi:hypothetical protein